MSHCGRLTNIPEAATHKVGVSMMLTLFLFLMQASPAQAHGAHAIFLSPAVGQEVAGSVELHVDTTPQPFPYINVAIRSFESQHPVWEGLVPREDNGYRRVIDLEGWKPGEYWIAVQFLGDLVEQIHKRSFVIQH